VEALLLGTRGSIAAEPGTQNVETPVQTEGAASGPAIATAATVAAAGAEIGPQTAIEPPGAEEFSAQPPVSEELQPPQRRSPLGDPPPPPVVPAVPVRAATVLAVTDENRGVGTPKAKPAPSTTTSNAPPEDEASSLPRWGGAAAAFALAMGGYWMIRDRLPYVR
jgi:hypothetical protein